MYLVFALALLLVYLVLAGQYESWFAPVAVLLAVPLSLIGPVATLTRPRHRQQSLCADRPVLLIALSAKNAILIVEVARETARRGQERSSRRRSRRRGRGSGRS